jgi:hypothetical protein
MDEKSRKELEYFISLEERDAGELELREEYLWPTREWDSIHDYLSSGHGTLFQVAAPPVKDELTRLLRRIAWTNPKNFRPAQGSEEYWKLRFDILKWIGSALQLYAHRDPHGATLSFIGDTFYAFQRGKGEKPSALNTLFLAPNHEAYLKFRILRCLENLPGSVLGRCLDCQRIFINYSFRPKKFCSKTCLWRFNSRRWRKDHPHYSAKKAQEKYERDLQPKNGGGPKVKVNRKVKRTKEEK